MSTLLKTLSPSDLVDLTHWDFIDSGRLPAPENMALDTRLLEEMELGARSKPILRFFDWTEPSVTFGYLLDEAKVHAWAARYGHPPVVKRPSGGGAVYHLPGEFTFSLLFPKGHPDFPSHPRALYEAIHKKVFTALEGRLSTELFIKPPNSCEQPKPVDQQGRFSACFTEPVCNDLMLNGRKILGGALRVARRSVLYQGALQLPA